MANRYFAGSHVRRRESASVEIFLPCTSRIPIIPRYSLLETRTAGERKITSIRQCSTRVITRSIKSSFKGTSKRVLHNADIWSEPAWIFQRIRNEREQPQGEANLRLSVKVRTGNRLRLPLHPPAIDASLISLLKPGDLAATRADIFVYKSNLWPGGPSRARDINVIQRLCAVHLHNVILKHLHNASIRGAAPRVEFFRTSLSVPGANRILPLLHSQFRRSFRESRRAKSSRVIRQISRIWNAREIFTKRLAAQTEESSAECDDDLCTRIGHAYCASFMKRLRMRLLTARTSGPSVYTAIHVRYTYKKKLFCKWWWII